MINTDWLKTFSVLAETQSFTSAAKQLHMTQPGVSQHLAKLEDYLGQALVIREGRHFELTPRGKTVLDYARNLLENERTLIEQIGDEDPHRGNCIISLPGNVGNLIYPWLLDLQAQWPQLHIHIIFNPTREVEILVRQNACDFGILSHRPVDPELSQELYMPEKLWLVMPKGVELESFAQLEALGFIDHPDARLMATTVFAEVFPRQEINISALNTVGYTNSAPRICDHVARGLGYTVLDEFLVRSSPMFDQLSIHNPNNSPSGEFSFVFRKSWPLHPRHRFVIDYLKQRYDSYRSELESKSAS
ncbi:LysR family transcriptional regulator [Microbulbifer hainanensis]|uniref:LysR family transcriptional regulator n=1 Tax=Microbulbifer hainanensis TaxID=2735675 RepID=UPI0018679B10|nr:LysR family transcriptional regulator [Microbulbifer hainanensis]